MKKMRKYDYDYTHKIDKDLWLEENFEKILKKVEFSNHALFDREERIMWIATEVGFGDVVDTIIIYDEERNHRRVELTETGVAIIKAADKEFVITMYLPTQRQLVKWYGSKNAVPIRLLNVAKRNEKKGWTNNGL